MTIKYTPSPPEGDDVWYLIQVEYRDGYEYEVANWASGQWYACGFDYDEWQFSADEREIKILAKLDLAEMAKTITHEAEYGPDGHWYASDLGVYQPPVRQP